MCRLLAACTLQHQCSSCSLMCYHVFLHNSSRGALAREILGQHHTAVHTQTEARGFLRRRAYAPYGASCRNHMFYKNPGEGGRRGIWQALTFPFQLQKIQPPSKCQDALYTHFRSKAQIYHRNYIKRPWVPEAMPICCFSIRRQTFALHFLIIWHIVWFIRAHNWEAVWHKSLNMWFSAIEMRTADIYPTDTSASAWRSNHRFS